MKTYTKRVVSILKQVLADIDELKKKGVEPKSDDVEIVAYTAKTTTPNITRMDVEMMIRELECRKDDTFTECWAPETTCPDQLLKFEEGVKDNHTIVTVMCGKECIHHLDHKE